MAPRTRVALEARQDERALERTCKGKGVAQLVDKPAVGMEAIVDLTVFKGAKYAAMKAAAGM